jgi:hypothetical protein
MEGRMESEVIASFGKIAGLAGLSLGLFLLLFRAVINKNIFPSLNRSQAYSIIRLFMFFTWSIAIIGMFVWAYNEAVNSKETASSSTTSINGPVVSGVAGNVSIEYKYHSEPTIDLPIIDLRFPPNNGNEKLYGATLNDEKINELIISGFDELNAHAGKLVYIKFYTYVGFGAGIEHVTHSKNPRAGVVYEDNIYEFLDGFGGDRSNIKYGYAIELNDYRNSWGGSNRSVIIFPMIGNAFFDVNFMKSMQFEGIAKIKISGMQGGQFIEIIPSLPVGNLAKAYDVAKDKVNKSPTSKFEF